MNRKVTDEFSFVLKPSKFGVGVFTTHDIKKGTSLRLFGDERSGGQIGSQERFFSTKDVPKQFKDYCIDYGDKLLCPADFGSMPVGWYLNHSKIPNAFHKDLDYYALRDIKAGEEITIDYNSLGEPEEAKRNYYKK